MSNNTNWFELAKTYPLDVFIEEAYGIHVNTKHKCLCPFHPDKTPSLSIDMKKTPQKFKCFPCGASGSIIDFVMLKEGLEKVDAAKRILLHYGIEVGKPMSQEEQEKATKKHTEMIASNLRKKEVNEQKEREHKKSVIQWMTKKSPKLAENLYVAFQNGNRDVIDRTLQKFPNLYNRMEIAYAYLGWDYDHDSVVIINRRVKDGKTWNFKYYAKFDKEGQRVDNKWISTKNSTTHLFGYDFVSKEGPVFVCEGEKDAVNLMLLGCNAVSLGGVSNKWDDVEEDGTPRAEILRGRDVIVWYDHDQAGYSWGVPASRIIGEVAKSCTMCLFNYLGSFPNKYDVSDFLEDKNIKDGTALLESISYSVFYMGNILIEEIIDRYSWDTPSLKERKIALESYLVPNKITSFNDEAYNILKYIVPVRGEKDFLLEKLDRCHKAVMESSHKETILKYVNSLFIEDEKEFFSDIKSFKEFMFTKATILKDFRQTHIYDIYNGLFVSVTKAGYDFWKFRSRLYFWTGSYFCLVMPWEIEDFIFNTYMVMGKVEPKKQLVSVRDDVFKNLVAKATPMERYISEDKRTLNVRNGVLIIRKNSQFTFRNHHRKEDCATNMLEFDYDENATCPKWDKFLKRVLPDEGDRFALEEFMGYCLLPTHEYEAFLYMYGASGANGKSVIMEVIRGFFSKENVSSVDLAEFEGHELEALANKLVNIGSEVNSKKDLSAQLSVLKKLVSPYDTVSINPKFEKQFVLYPHEKPKCIFAGNKTISYDANDGGVLRRILMLTFDQEIKRKEMIRDLPTRLLDESSGILNRLLQGMARLRKNNGFTVSEKRAKQLDEFKNEINPIRAYIMENVTKSESLMVPKAMVYMHYQAWCEEEGRKPVPANIFWKEFKNIFPFETTRPNKNKMRHDIWGDRPTFIINTTLNSVVVEKVKLKGKDITIKEHNYDITSCIQVNIDV